MKQATLWDYFAANALAGVTGNEASGCNSPRDLAHWAASVADSMILERDRRASNRLTEGAAV
jgi:hypothetical protein